MKQLEEVKWGIIGCGDVTEVKSGPAFQRAEGSELLAVMRRNGLLAQDYARRHGVAKWYDHAQALIDDPQINAIYIATPPDSHEFYTLAAAKAGKAVYVEKPMGRTYQECQRMIKACDANNVPLYVAHYRRALPRFLKIKELIKQGAIGDVRYFSMRQHLQVRQAEIGQEKPWRVRPEISGGGKFLDYGTHMLDIIAYLLGDIEEVNGRGTNQGGYYEAEDMVTARLLVENKVQGIANWCYTAFEDYDLTEIVGSHGQLQFSIFGAEPVVLRTASGMETYDIAPPKHIQQPMIQTVVDDLRGIGTCESTGYTAARASKVMDEVLASYRATMNGER